MVAFQVDSSYLLDVKEFEKDKDIMVDVHRAPELYGLTYKAYLAMTFNADEEGTTKVKSYDLLVRKAKKVVNDVNAKTETREAPAENTSESAGGRVEL